MCSVDIGQVHKNSPYLLADLVELLLAVAHEGRTTLTPSDVSSLINDSTGALEELVDNSDEDETLSTAETHDKNQLYLDNLWIQLEYRAQRFGAFYPYLLEDSRISIRDELTNEQQLYIFLLACSRLRSFARTTQVEWAGYFSLLSASTLKAMMPSFADVKVFDANSVDRRDFYGTDKRDALVNLGKQLNVITQEEVCRNESASGDAGLDLVGVIHFDDKAASNFAMFGQCAAREKDWIYKTLEASPINLRGFFNFLIDPYNITCIPLCYRQATDEWPSINNTSGTLLLDRHRILYLLRKADLTGLVFDQDWWNQFTNQFFDQPQAA